MYDSPAYVWAIIIAGPIAIAATTCIALYGGAKRAGPGRRRAALLAGATAGLLGGWLTASAVIAGHGWYHTLPMARPPQNALFGHGHLADVPRGQRRRPAGVLLPGRPRRRASDRLGADGP
jgi:hypothetical protein